MPEPLVQPVRYAVLQKSLDVPPVDALRRAFKSVRCLVDSDADTLANDAFGILVKNLCLEDATTLQRALAAENVQTEAVPQPMLPPMPSTKFIRRIECGADALLVFDPIGRPFPVEWRHLMLIAAGNVLTTQFTRRTMAPTAAADRYAYGTWGRRPTPGVAASLSRVASREERNGVLTIDLVLTRGLARFTITADASAPLLFRVLGHRMTSEPATNFRLLLDDIGRAAPGAQCNRGAWLLRQDPPRLLEYPSSNAFLEEIVWMLWQHRRQAAP
jgi:hypothetical protein